MLGFGVGACSWHVGSAEVGASVADLLVNGFEFRSLRFATAGVGGVSHIETLLRGSGHRRLMVVQFTPHE